MLHYFIFSGTASHVVICCPCVVDRKLSTNQLTIGMQGVLVCTYRPDVTTLVDWA